MTSLFDLNIVLEDSHALLRRQGMEDLEEITAIATDPRIWKWFPTIIEQDDQVRKMVEANHQEQLDRVRYTFTIVDKASGRIAGSTSLAAISEYDGTVEIGYTWLGMDFHGTGLNTHCKYLLLTFLFEERGFKRVEFKADNLNTKSVKAIEKLGAVREGILRSRRQMYGDRRRDTVYYSILADDWPAVKAGLEARIGR